MESLNQIKAATQTGVTELLEAAHLKRGDLFVLGLSTSEVQGEHIGQDSNIEIGRTVVKAIVELLAPRGINLAVQGCEHLNRALVVERAVAEQRGLEIVTVYPQLHAGGAGQVAAFELFDDPVEVEHVVPRPALTLATPVSACRLSLSRFRYGPASKKLARPTLLTYVPGPS